MTFSVLVGVMGASTSAATSRNLTKLDTEVHLQWTAVVEIAKEEFRTSNSAVIASGLSVWAADPDTARKIWINLRLRQEFPVSFAEVVDKTTAPPSPAKIVFNDPKGVRPPVVIFAKQNYFKLFVSQNPGANAEASACLLASLTGSRKGALGKAEDALGASALRNINGSDVLMDMWGTPFGFQRIVASNGIDLTFSVNSAGSDRIMGTYDDLRSDTLRQTGRRGEAQ
jgi:hypothetical protein